MSRSEGASRRGLLRALLLTPAALALAPGARATETCTTDTSDGLPGSVHFQLTSTDPAKHCSGCTFWQAASADANCANCQILSRTTPANARCDSWTARG